MAGVVGGLGAAVIWAVGSIFASRAARALGPTLTLAWVMLVGFVLVGAILPWSGAAHISPAAAAWLFLGGAGNVSGLLLMYRSLRLGQMGVVMPIVATEGGIAALASIIAGQPVSAAVAVAMVATMVGVILTGVARRPSGAPGAAPQVADRPAAVAAPRGHGDRRAAAWASLGAILFGISLFATGRAGDLLPAAWAVMPPRLVGVLAVTLPLAMRRRLRWARGTGHMVLISGVCEVAGFFSYTLGARHDIAVAAVLATLTGAFAAAFGRLLFDERLQATQVIGVIVILTGVAILSALTA